jgi:chromosome segregation ATPase
MVRQAEQPGDSGPDLDQTAELLALDVASYEEQRIPRDKEDEQPAPEPPDAACEDRKLQPVLALPPTETLRHIEAWIAAQDARVRSYEHALTELQQERDGVKARAENLALELEIARQAVHTALSRANDGERAALDNGAAARAAEARTAQSQTELQEAKKELATAAERLETTAAELTRTRDSLAGKALEHEEVLRRLADLTRSLQDRSKQLSELEGEIADLRTHIAEANHELSQRAERIGAISAASERQQALVTEVARERDALAVRFATVLENAQSMECKRNVWESVWHALDSDVSEARALLRAVEAERAAFAASVDKVNAELAERDAAGAQLKAECMTQATALEELGATRSREQRDYALQLQQLRLHAETLATQIGALEERLRSSAESVAAAEAELDKSCAARAGLEDTLRRVQASEAAHAATAGNSRD